SLPPLNAISNPNLNIGICKLLPSAYLDQCYFFKKKLSALSHRLNDCKFGDFNTYY
ncbi:5183_t:CDS:1, partial [Entrophospora sp. SA101]